MDGVGVYPAMWWKARPDLSCEYASPAWLDFTGCTADEALGNGWTRGVHPEDLARWLDTVIRAFDAHCPFEIQFRQRRRDGQYRWVLERAVPRYDPDGRFAGYTGMSVDIDDLKRTQLALARALQIAGLPQRFFSGGRMNWDRIEGNWKQLKGELKQRWGKLTDDEFDQMAGSKDKLVGKIQERYGCARDDAERQVNDWNPKL